LHKKNHSLQKGKTRKPTRRRLGHESLDVTLAYLKGKDAESEEAQEHANSSSLALYASGRNLLSSSHDCCKKPL
jgi:hypothetical protein